MLIERSLDGTLHVIDTDGTRSVRFQSNEDQPLFQLLASMLSNAPETGYDVQRFTTARLVLRIESDDEPDYAQHL